MSNAAAPPPADAKKPEWAPRMWEGCNSFAWLRLLIRNRFAVEFRYWYIAIIVTFVSLGHSFLRIVQEAIFGRALRKVELKGPPIFILGHWRTGTTLLHELMICDERFGYPTTYECMDPNHFLLTEGLFTRWLRFLVPTQRPMDNMKAGFDRPQEDEFALCMLGAGSPYLTVAFPNHPPQFQEYLDLEGVSAKGLRRWKRTLKDFLKRVTYKSGKRLVLKSPPHTARIKPLREMFPGAIFIHIVRDPYVVFPSTVNLWRTLYKTHGLQTPTGAGIEQLVLDTYARMYRRLEEGKQLLGPEQFYELRYEDLIKDPPGEMRKIFDHFKLGGYEQYLPRLQAYLASIKDYETNKYQLSDAQRSAIAERWGEVIRRYGYE
ncbi:MAG TPA: sulfotransferase [Gemmataceae bacterium]|nr:sulfotransferase [Gemmataceae bacterium]